MCKISSATLRHPTVWNIYSKSDLCPAVYVVVGIKFQPLCHQIQSNTRIIVSNMQLPPRVNHLGYAVIINRYYVITMYVNYHLIQKNIRLVITSGYTSYRVKSELSPVDSPIIVRYVSYNRRIFLSLSLYASFPTR